MRPELSALERRLLWSVFDLGPFAYGAKVWRHVESHTGRSYSLGALYIALDDLVDMGLLRTWTEQGGQERAGRDRRHYAITLPQIVVVREFGERPAGAGWGYFFGWLGGEIGLLTGFFLLHSSAAVMIGAAVGGMVGIGITISYRRSREKAAVRVRVAELLAEQDAGV